MKIFKQFLGWLGKIRWNIYAFLVLAFFGIYVVTAINWYFDEVGYLLSDKREDWGTFGDFIGGLLNPLFAFLSFLALLYTIHLQRKELKENREFQQKERFESTFFILLEHLNKVSISSGEIENVKNALNSSSILKEANESLKNQNDIVAHYFRTLFQLLKFVYTDCPIQKGEVQRKNGKNLKNSASNENNQATEEEKFYSNIVRASLSNNLMFLLAINCYCSKEKEDDYWGYKLLVERYQFFEHLKFPKSDKLKKDIFISYHKNVFGDSFKELLIFFEKELKSEIERLLCNLLALRYQNSSSDDDRKKIRDTIKSLTKHPDLAKYLDTINISDIYNKKPWFTLFGELPYPNDCPFTLKQILDDNFYPKL